MNNGSIDNVLITAGITAYNAANTIESAIQSALAQTWRQLEIVIVDDVSTDETPAILERLAGRHPEIRVFRNPYNSGVAATRNRILEEASGVFAVFFDDDDVSMPDRITQQYRRICDYERDYASGQPVICHTARLQRYPDGTEHVCHTMGARQGLIAPHGKAVADRILRSTPLVDGYGACATCSQMGRIATYNALGGFDINLRRAEDTDFNVRLALAGGHFVGISSPLVIQNLTRTPEKTLDEECCNTLYLLDKHRAIMDRAGEYEFSRRWLEGKYAWLRRNRVRFLQNLLSLFLQHPIWTLQRLGMAAPNIMLNRAFSRFHNIQSRQHGEYEKPPEP